MKTDRSISQELQRQAIVHMECTIPAEMTIEEWRRSRSQRRRPARRRSSRLRREAQRVVPLRPVPCDHLHDTTTRYDHGQKQLTFLLVCHVCGTERLVETVPYEPRFKPHPEIESSDGTVHQLPIRRPSQPTQRAA